MRSMTSLPPPAHAERADLRQGWGERHGAVAAGSGVGANGSTRVLLACCAVALLFGAVCTVNALSQLDEAARHGERLAAWKAFGREHSSWLGLVLALPVVLLVERVGGRLGWAGRLGVWAAGSLLYCFIHLAVMVAARHILWSAMGEAYRFDAGREWLYEFRKDSVSYVAALAAVLVARHAWQRPDAAPGAATDEVQLATLSDGRRRIDIDVRELCAVSGGGNYVELIFAGGRRRLLRTTLAAAEPVLAGAGFRRTHRSWLIRLRCVTAAERTPSGDYRLTLGEGLAAPLSRRSPAVLAEIRAALATQI
jgi:hypothetical protein